jgi:hypothetical protein
MLEPVESFNELDIVIEYERGVYQRNLLDSHLLLFVKSDKEVAKPVAEVSIGHSRTSVHFADEKEE